jgi:hypothetical protein
MKWSRTMSGAWPFYDITDSHYIWGFTISWQNRLILFWGLTISWHNRLILCLGLDHFMTTRISLFCHEMVKPQTKYQSVLSWNIRAPDIVSVCFVMKWSSPRIVSVCFVMKWSIPRHSVSLLCHKMVLCLRFEYFMTKQIDTMSGPRTFHDNTDWYYVWGLIISWQNRLILWHSINLFCHEMIKPQK